MSQQVNHNEVTRAILSMDLGSDCARVARTIANGGQILVDTIGALLSVESLSGMNQKAIMRAVQAVSFAVSGAVEDLNKTTAHIVAMLMMTADERIAFESARFLCGQTGMIAPTSVNGVSRAKLQRFIGRAGTAKTIESQVSRSVGKRGFLTGLGVTAKSDAHGFTLSPNARQSAFVLGYAHQLQALTDGALALVYGDDE